MRIIQLETAVGAAMKNFEGAHGKGEHIQTALVMMMMIMMMLVTAAILMV